MFEKEPKQEKAQETIIVRAESTAPKLSYTEPAKEIAPEVANDLSEVGHRITEKYSPHFLKEGGGQIVYELFGRDVVAKVDKSLTRELFLEADRSKNPEALSESMRTKINKHIEEHKTANSTLRQYFGREHVPPLRTYALKVPATRQSLSLLIGAHVTVPPSEIWTAVTLQRRVDQVADEDALSFLSGYTERHSSKKMSDEKYIEGTMAIFSKDKDTPRHVPYGELLTIQGSEELIALFDAAQSDPELHETIKDFVKKAIRFSKETGDILDLAGSRNVSFYKHKLSQSKNGEEKEAWTYQLIDAEYPGNRQAMIKAREAMRAIEDDMPLQDEQKCDLLNGLNYARALNAAASILEIDDRIELVRPSTDLATVKHTLEEIVAHQDDAL